MNGGENVGDSKEEKPSEAEKHIGNFLVTGAGIISFWPAYYDPVSMDG